MREVQAQRAGRRGQSAKRVVTTDTSSMFDLMYCTACGSRMWYQPPSGTRTRAYFQCSQRATGGACKAGMVQAEAVEAGMLEIVESLAIPAEWHDEIIRRAERLASLLKLLCRLTLHPFRPSYAACGSSSPMSGLTRLPISRSGHGYRRCSTARSRNGLLRLMSPGSRRFSGISLPWSSRARR
jgi:hypothetical protein